VEPGALVERFGSMEHAAAHVLGRRMREVERGMLDDSGTPLALLLSSPAFQRH
jgi:hypothetical protein